MWKPPWGVSVWLTAAVNRLKVETSLCPVCALWCAAACEMSWMCPVSFHRGITYSHAHTLICIHLPRHFEIKSEVCWIKLGAQRLDSTKLQRWEHHTIKTASHCQTLRVNRFRGEGKSVWDMKWTGASGCRFSHSLSPQPFLSFLIQRRMFGMLYVLFSWRPHQPTMWTRCSCSS